MWFILLFAVFGMAIPLVLEIHFKGRDNLLTRSGEEILHSRWGRAIRRSVGDTTDGVLAALAVAFVLLAVWIVFRLVAWLLGLVF